MVPIIKNNHTPVNHITIKLYCCLIKKILQYFSFIIMCSGISLQVDSTVKHGDDVVDSVFSDIY